MREMMTDKHVIYSKLLLVIKIIFAAVLMVFFVPLFVLPFFNAPSTDDYFCGFHLQQLGLVKYQQYVYTECGGRFSATLAGALPALNNFIFEHYYLHTIVLLVLNIGSLIILLHTINRYFLKQILSILQIVVIALVLLVAGLISVPEPATFLFWYSSAITYQLPLILLQMQLAGMIWFCYTKKAGSTTIAALLISILVMGINGFNELFLMAQFFILGLFYYVSTPAKTGYFQKIVLPALFIVSALVVLLANGNEVRAERIEPKGIFTGITAIVFLVSEIGWSICKSPLNWMICVAFFICGHKLKAQLQQQYWYGQFAKKMWMLPVLVFGFLMVSVALPVIALKGGMVPERYLNGVVYIVLFALYFSAILFGAKTEFHLNAIWLDAPVGKILVYTILCIGILANSFFAESIKSLIAAPVYHAILNNRTELLKKAAEENTIAILPTYEKALEAQIQTNYGQSSKTLVQLVSQKPSLLFFEDDLATPYSIDILKNYYGVKGIELIK
ncbi:hypothetical protein [Limnovirga soli]|uniref:Uncharacterized protein n=1 Tax=Limnovirga soli TaxID=2656915 RepID=A0A8J8JUI4_9BACT|nr:hypothetical protein [Limnovirga soli]NNV56330.1 hypothetical protein [Limnovirga soli]